jgi:hypothetical protein
LFAVLLLLPGCTKEEIIFVEKPLFDDPPAEAAGFMGYVTSEAADQGQTVCGTRGTACRAAVARRSSARAATRTTSRGARRRSRAAG